MGVGVSVITTEKYPTPPPPGGGSTTPTVPAVPGSPPPGGSTLDQLCQLPPPGGGQPDIRQRAASLGSFSSFLFVLVGSFLVRSLIGRFVRVSRY